MRKEAIRFESDAGIELHGDLYLPSHAPHAGALVAHCFTCAANFKAPVRIARALCHAGFGVLAFDFTGLGRSGGEFADTNFTTNVADLVAAARYLERSHGIAPDLLVGHSLGGTASLAAATSIERCKAVVTINAPASAAHLMKLLENVAPDIESTGEGVVEIGGRPFRIKKQLLDDIERNGVPQQLGRLGRALLVMHSPADTVVSIDEASAIFQRAAHPKSFVSLDDADHLLSDEEDADYAAAVLAAWASRYVGGASAEQRQQASDDVVATTGPDGFVTSVDAAGHRFIADEPVRLGGTALGPTPYDLVAAALASCTSMTLQLYARRKGFGLENATVRVRHSRVHAEDCAECDTRAAKVDRFERALTLTGSLSDAERRRLLEIAERCPVHRTLESQSLIETRLDQRAADGET